MIMRWISDVPSKIVKVVEVRAVSAGRCPARLLLVSTNSAPPPAVCRGPSLLLLVDHTCLVKNSVSFSATFGTYSAFQYRSMWLAPSTMCNSLGSFAFPMAFWLM